MASSEEDTRQKDKRKDRLKERDRRDRDRTDKVKSTKTKSGTTKRKADDDSEEDIEKEKEKDKMAFLAAIKGLRDKDKAKEKARRKKTKKSSSSRSPSVRKDRKKEKDTKRKREQSRSRDDSSGSASPAPKKELVTASGFGAPLALPVTSIVPAAVGASDVIGVFCRSAGADQNSEQALRALPVHLQQLVMAEGSIAGLNPSAVLIGRIRKVENNAGAANAAAAAGLHRPRPETVAAAAAGDPVAKFCMQHAVDYSAENALRALPVELQCKILNEGPLRASNPSAVLMSRIRKAQTLLAEMRRLGKVPV